MTFPMICSITCVLRFRAISVHVKSPGGNEKGELTGQVFRVPTLVGYLGQV